ncbi:MAG: hypothetical protein FWG85_02430, partial [Bacteroidetes bacterium]|nr:hypothetical protein [Bacteroidota bacterium]
MNNYIKVFRKVLSLAGFIAVLLAISTPSAEGQWIGLGTHTDPYEIHFVADLNTLASNVNAGNSYLNVFFKLMSDIPTFTQMIGDDVNYFAGYFDGQNNKITVNINENATNVGLFSQVDGGSIYNLIVDGSVVGGQQRENVGGFVGEFLSGDISSCTNLADVTGLAYNSSVGGIAGAVGYNGGGMIENNNNGTITGGQYVAGIAGK